MAKFTATVPLNIRLPGGFEVSGAAGATHRIPDSLVEEFERDQAARIPGFAWVVQDEATAVPAAIVTTSISAASITATSILASTLTADALRAKGSPWFDVKAYGALGDGAADDIGAFNLAISALSAAGGGTIFVPAGTYIVKAPVTLPSKATLQGEGRVSVIKADYTSGAFNAIIRTDHTKTTGDTDITLRSFRVDRSGPLAQHGIHLRGVTRLTIDAIEVVGDASVASGALAISALYNSATSILSKDVLVRGCYFEQTDNFGVQVGHVQNVIIEGNRFYDSNRECIGVEPDGSGSTAKNVTIIGNIIQPLTSDTGSQTGCIIVTESSGFPVQDVTIVGNVVINAGTVGQNGQPGITVLGGENIVVADNVLRGLDGAGVIIGSALFTTPGVVVKGNVIQNCATSAIGIALSNAVGCVITANRVTGSTTGIEELLTANLNTIFGNDLVGNTTPLTTLGAGTLAYGNKRASHGRFDHASIGGHVFNSVNIAIASAAATALTFDSERSDSDAFHSTSSNTGRLTVPSGLAGKYVVGANVHFTGSTAGLRRLLTIRKNGTTTVAQSSIPPVSTQTASLFVAYEDDAVAGDYYEVVVLQDTAGNLNVLATPEFWIRRVGT